jgi:WD40 repeat protein
MSTQITYRGHTQPVRAVAWSPDGKHIASGSDDQTVQVWSATTGQHVFTYYPAQNAGAVYALSWSPDSTRIASGGKGGHVHVWNAFTGQQLYSYDLRVDDVLDVAWSPDGKYLAGTAGSSAPMWVADSGRHRATFDLLNGKPEREGRVSALAWSPKSTYLALSDNAIVPGHNSEVQVWEVQTVSQVSSSRAVIRPVNALAWGQRLASAGEDSHVNVWDASTGTLLLPYAGHARPVYAVAWLPREKRVASGGADQSVHVWNGETGQFIYAYHGHTHAVLGIAWSPDGSRIASCSADNTVQVWS